MARKYFTVLLFILTGFGFLSAQKKMSEGVIMMEITNIDSDDPAVADMLSNMLGSTQDIYFSKGKQKLSMNMMGGLISMNIFTDLESKESRSYMDMMGQKMLIKAPISEDDNESQDVEITEDPTKTKVIAGYPCKFARIRAKDSGDLDAYVDMYFTDEIKLVGSVSSQINTGAIKGAPLEYSVVSPGFKMVYSTVKISDKLPKDAFNEPKGYKEISQEEFQKMMGGFGF